MSTVDPMEAFEQFSALDLEAVPFVVSRVIAPGDEVPLTFRLPRLTEPSRFWVSITYHDLSYERRYRGRIVFDQKRPRPLLLDATVEDLNFKPAQVQGQATDESGESTSS